MQINYDDDTETWLDKAYCMAHEIFDDQLFDDDNHCWPYKCTRMLHIVNKMEKIKWEKKTLKFQMSPM